ncbi:uncharacterized protein LOC141702958 [Apium graveolens]|uniref:uncharacterized protein LOC141702958 n=1 Tax=Apium graveolens TaxID=4045 RepID=UPI003D7B6829
MKVFIQAQGVWTAIEPSDAKAPVDEKSDKVALTMIYQGIPEDILLSLAVDKKTAKEAWEAIKTLCQGADRVKQTKIQTLKTEFESMTMKENESIDDFSMKLNGLVRNIKALGESMNEAYVVKKLLRAVPTKFLLITSTLEQFSDLETMIVEEAVGSLKAYEERVKGKVETNEGQLLLTEEEWKKRENDDGKLLFTREEWLKRQNKGGFRGRDKSKVRCYNCQIYGHYAADCRKPKRTKEPRHEANIAQVEDDEPTLLLAKHDKEESGQMMLNEPGVMPLQLSKNTE